MTDRLAQEAGPGAPDPHPLAGTASDVQIQQASPGRTGLDDEAVSAVTKRLDQPYQVTLVAQRPYKAEHFEAPMECPLPGGCTAGMSLTSLTITATIATGRACTGQ